MLTRIVCVKKIISPVISIQKYYNIASKFITWLVNLSNQIQLRERASYSYCARSRRQQKNPSGKKIFHRVENAIKQLVPTLAVRSSSYEVLGKFGELSRS